MFFGTATTLYCFESVLTTTSQSARLASDANWEVSPWRTGS